MAGVFGVEEVLDLKLEQKFLVIRAEETIYFQQIPSQSTKYSLEIEHEKVCNKKKNDDQPCEIPSDHKNSIAIR